MAVAVENDIDSGEEVREIETTIHHDRKYISQNSLMRVAIAFSLTCLYVDYASRRLSLKATNIAPLLAILVRVTVTVLREESKFIVSQLTRNALLLLNAWLVPPNFINDAVLCAFRSISHVAYLPWRVCVRILSLIFLFKAKVLLVITEKS